MISGTSRASRTVSRIVFAAVGATCMALSSWVCSAEEHVTAGPSFSDEELKIILSHGPWPAPAPHDPTNRVSGKPDAIELGTLLFFDQRLSGSGTKACASCHVPERNWTDNLRRGVGVAELDRNTPTLMNVRGQRWYGWDGAADSLWSQSLRPIVDVRELAATPRHVADLVRGDEQLSCRYGKVFGAPPSPTDDEAVFVNVGKALAAFQETLFSGRTPFDQFRDALARGESPSSLSYSTPAQRGLQIFIGKGGCTSCHSGPELHQRRVLQHRPLAVRAAQASPIPDATRESGNCGRAVSTCWARTTTTRRAPALRAPGRSPWGEGTTASSRCRHCVT